MVAQALRHELLELLAPRLGDALPHLLLPRARPPSALLPSHQLLRGPAHPGGVICRKDFRASNNAQVHCPTQPQTQHIVERMPCSVPPLRDMSSAPCRPSSCTCWPTNCTAPRGFQVVYLQAPDDAGWPAHRLPANTDSADSMAATVMASGRQSRSAAASSERARLGSRGSADMARPSAVTRPLLSSASSRYSCRNASSSAALCREPVH